MRALLLLFSITLLSLSVQAQQDTSNYIITLKDGSEIKGIVIEKDPQHYIKVRVKDKIYTYTIDELQSIEKKRSEIIKEAKPQKPPMVFKFKKRGYIGSFSIGLSSLFAPKNQVVSSNNQLFFSVDIINAYQATPLFAIGVGVGAEIAGKNGAMIPVYEDMRIFFSRSHSVFMELAFGYNAMITLASLTINGNTTNSYQVYHGLMFNPSIGFSGPVYANKLAIFLTVGYKLWYQHIIVNEDYESFDSFVARHGFTAKIGLMF